MTTSHWIFRTCWVRACPRGTGSPDRHWTPRARATTPRPSHTAALGAPGKRRGAAVELGERGAWEGALPGTACSVPGNGGDPRDRRGFHRFWKAFHSRDFFCRVLVFGFPFVWKAFFFRVWNTIIPLVFFCILALGSAVERSTMNADDFPGSSPTFRASFCFFNCMGFSMTFFPLYLYQGMAFRYGHTKTHTRCLHTTVNKTHTLLEQMRFFCTPRSVVRAPPVEVFFFFFAFLVWV